jgi:large subunit ribosomal protein L25
MERVELMAENRMARGKRVKQLRAKQYVPAVVYGPDTPSKPIQIKQRELSNALRLAGSTTLINLTIDDGSKPQVVLAREIQRDILTGWVQHVDFYQVRLTEKVRTTPRLEVVGESPAVRSGKAVMIHGMNEVEVECLPTDLINSIPVDVSGLETLEDSILVGDLPIPEGVTVMVDPNEVVVSLVSTRAALRAAAEVAALTGAGVSEEPTVEEPGLEEPEAEVDAEAEA